MLASGDTSSVMSLFDAIAGEHVAVRDELALVNADRLSLAGEIERRDAKIAFLLRLAFGRRSERLTAEDMRQLVLVYGGTEAEAAAAEPDVPVREPTDEPAEEQPRRESKKRRHPGRTKLSADLERKVTEVVVSEGERACQVCGQQMTCIGHREHERVEYVPAKFIVHVERRETLACVRTQCHGDATTAARVAEPALVTRVDASVLAYLIESKCDDGLPIHRQCDQFSRLGFDVPVDTLYGYWRYATNALLPISDSLLGEVLGDPHYVGIDDTGLDVLDTTRKGGKYRGHLWCFRGSRPLVAYAFTQSWEADEVAPWIWAISEDVHIQVDDYGGYSKLVDDPNGNTGPLVPLARRLGCMMHVRRRFHAAFKGGDKRAGFAIEQIRKLYEIEAKARGLLPDERLALRREHSMPILEAFYARSDGLARELGNTGLLAEAVRYANAQREFITRCFTDGRFEIDNGQVERAIREPAIGRKNFLFTGSAKAAARLAAAYGLVQSCRALGISTREYLIDVIEKVERGWSMRRVAELLPHNWAADRGITVTAT
ncbi:MAG TPA: IS66 family transposase [Nannocystaceae bacterium]|nr:IS66 family transposase [Nannocystaceae bacterium]